MKKFSNIAATLIILMGLQCQNKESTEGSASSTSEFSSNRGQMREDLKIFSAAPHPLGSKQQETVRDFLVARLKDFGFESKLQKFFAQTPNPILMKTQNSPSPTTISKEGVNILTLVPKNNAPCLIAIGSHYDTKIFESFTYRGANDSGSSSVALLYILDYLSSHSEQQKCHYLGIWFDGEEAVLGGWHDGESRHPARLQDNTYGSRYFVSQLVSCSSNTNEKHCLPQELGGYRISALILLDMIGSPNIKISRDSNSSPRLLKLLQQVDSELFKESIISRGASSPIDDDHIPFIEQGIEAIDIIDFNNLSVWHQPGDDEDKVSTESMIKASQLTLGLIRKMEASY